MFSKPGGPSGMEMLIGQAMKAAGIDPAQIVGLASAMETTFKTLIEGQQKAQHSLDAIAGHLGVVTMTPEEIERQAGLVAAELALTYGGSDHEREI